MTARLLGARALTRRRYTASAWTAGRWVRDPSPVDTSFRGSVQRLDGQEWQALEEGDRQRDSRKVYTRAPGFLRTDDQHGETEADDVLIDGVAYRVTMTHVSHSVLPHGGTVVVRVGEHEQVSDDPTGHLAAVEDAFRAWLVGAGADGGIADPDRAVIIANGNGPRPPLPYLAINVDSYDVRWGRDQERPTDTSVEVYGTRTGLVRVLAFGRPAIGWLERASALRRLQSSRDLLGVVDVEQVDGDGLSDTSTLVDTGVEPRSQRVFRIRYERRPRVDEPEPRIELETVQLAEEHAPLPPTTVDIPFPQ